MKRAHVALFLNTLVGLMCLPVFAQDAPEKPAQENAAAKNAADKAGKEQTAAEKAKADSNSGFSSNNFPDVEGPVELRAGRNAHITLKLSDSSSAVFEAIGRQGKINVIFDPDYTPRPISVDFAGVSLQDALKVAAFESRSFWRPVTPDTIFVAPDTQAKRREFEQQVIKTFYLPNISSPRELQDVVNAIRTIADVQRIQQMPDYQTIIVRATQEQMAVTEKLIADATSTKSKTSGQYRLEFKVSEWGEDKKVNSRTYSLLLEPVQVGKLRIGPRIPVETSEKDKTYVEAGKNIDCQVRAETERTVSVKLTLELTDVGVDEHNAPESAHGNPILQQLKIDTSVLLELGAPTVVSSFQDPVSKHNFQIEATAVRAKAKE